MKKEEESLTTQSINDFLKENVEDGNETKEVKLKRFKSPFVIKALTAKESDDVLKSVTVKHRNKRTGQTTADIDSDKYGKALLVKSIVTPDLNSKVLQENYGTIADPAGTLQAMLMASEINTLSEAVTELSGLGDDDNVDALSDQAKK